MSKPLYEVDKSELVAEYQRLIASACLVAWLDATDRFESTYGTKKNRRELKLMAQDWIKGRIDDDWIPTGTYRHWLELLDMDPNMEPEGLIKKHGAELLVWWNE